MSKLSTEDVLNLARLARLRLTAAEVERYAKELSVLLEYVKTLETVDTKGLEPTAQVTGLTNVTRPDEPIDYGPEPDDLLKNIPHTEGRYMKVKRMIT